MAHVGFQTELTGRVIGKSKIQNHSSDPRRTEMREDRVHTEGCFIRLQTHNNACIVDGGPAATTFRKEKLTRLRCKLQGEMITVVFVYNMYTGF